MNIVKVVQVNGDLFFTGVDRKGMIKVGIIPKGQAGKQKIDWGYEVKFNS